MVDRLADATRVILLTARSRVGQANLPQHVAHGNATAATRRAGQLLLQKAAYGFGVTSPIVLGPQHGGAVALGWWGPLASDERRAGAVSGVSRAWEGDLWLAVQR